MNVKLYTLTAIDGIAVGHVTIAQHQTGCTVVLCPPHTVCGIAQNGGGSGTRETDAFRPGSLVECVDAIAFSGGSVFGLSVADGVLQFLREHERGMRTAGGIVPIVPAAIIYDLLRETNFYPDARMGYEACTNASVLPVSSGPIGAGTGATIGKYGGTKTARPAGIGNAGIQVSAEIKLAVMLVVNAFGQVVQPQRELSEAEQIIFNNFSGKTSISQNTVLGVVATNACLTKDELTIVARMAQSGLARAIYPSHTPFDGDTIFAISTGTKPYDVFSLGALAQRLTQEAVYDAIITR
jgi:L-aminopeptidase/D-esterase-like protein